MRNVILERSEYQIILIARGYCYLEFEKLRFNIMTK